MANPPNSPTLPATSHEVLNQPGPASSAAEDADVATAIRLSLEERERVNPQLATSSPHARTFNHGAQPEPSTDLILSLNNEFSALDDSKGDTVVYIGPPSRMPGQTDADYRYMVKHFDQAHVVKSSNLRLMGESSRFTDEDLLNPTKSFRAERKLRKLGVLEKVEGKRGKFKYYVDLRPPREDDEAVILITELTCTRGVLTWHLASDKYSLSPTAVLGHDEFGIQVPVGSVPASKAAESSSEDNQAHASGGGPSKNGSTSRVVLPEAPIAPEYSLLRHCSAIERLLHAIQGNDPKLDSAPKVWTYFAIARYFGCAAHERVSGWITTWIYTHSNANFIQNNPEVAYRIGMGIKSPELVRDAFSILVGERALLEVYGEYKSSILSPLVKSVHGRKLEHLDDDERNRIDHAASAFVRRLRGDVSKICQDMTWLRESRHFAMLDAVVGRTAEEVEMLDSVKLLVKEYVRSRIYFVLCQEQVAFDELEQNPASTLAFRNSIHENYRTVYNTLNQPIRMFTKTFWLALQVTNFEAGAKNTAGAGTPGGEKETAYTRGLRELYREDPLNGIITISRETLDGRISDVNRMLANRAIESGRKGKEPSHGYPWAPMQEHQYSSDPGAIEFGKLSIRNPDATDPRSESSFQPAKRRRTLESDDVSQATSSGVDFPGISGGLDTTQDSWNNSTTGLLPAEAQTTTALNVDQPSLALRPKSERPNVGALDQMKKWYRQHRVSVLEDTAVRDAHLNGLPNAPTHEPEGYHPASYEPVPTSEGSSSIKDEFPSQSQYPDSVPWEWQSTPEWDAWNADPPGPDRDEDDVGRPTQVRFRIGATNTNLARPSAVTPGHLWYPIHAENMLKEFTGLVANLCSSILVPPHVFHPTGVLNTNLFDCLLSLGPNEFRYLPLWDPDGNDDGSGGVFDECPVPNLDPASEKIESFRAGRIKRPYDQTVDGDGDGQSDAALSGSGFEEVGSSQAISTVGKASRHATDGTETVKSFVSAVEIGVPVTPHDDSQVVVLGHHTDDDAESAADNGDKGSGTDGDDDYDGDSQMEDEFDDDVGDGDTINGDSDEGDDGQTAHAMSESLKAFINSSGDDHGYGHVAAVAGELETAIGADKGKAREVVDLPYRDRVSAREQTRNETAEPPKPQPPPAVGDQRGHLSSSSSSSSSADDFEWV